MTVSVTVSSPFQVGFLAGPAVAAIVEEANTHEKSFGNGKGKTKAEDTQDPVAAAYVGKGSNIEAGKGKQKACAARLREKPPKRTRSGRQPTQILKLRGRTKNPEEAPSKPLEQPRETCLQKARDTYHFKTCGKNQEWLHRQQAPVEDTDYQQDDVENTHQDHYGTSLSLLLLDVLDRTLLISTNSPDSRILPHEIDEMLLLCCDEDLPEQRFPFTYSANIVVPFNILTPRCRHL